jgi:hypothetical protein
MKLRIKGNSIRLRLTQSEAARLSSSGVVEDAISFGPEPDEALTYSVRTSDDTDAVEASFRSGRIEIVVPALSAREWYDTDQVSIEASETGPDAKPAILVEKDFTCLKPRASDEDIDTFENPRSAETC